MKKTLLLTIDFPPHHGGVAGYLKHLCDQLNPKELVVLAQRAKNGFLFDTQQKYPVFRAPLFYLAIWPHWLKGYRVAKQLVEKEQVEHLIISHVLPMGYIALLLGLPFTVICHGYDVLAAQVNPWKEYWLKRVLKKAMHIVANSNYTKGEIAKLGIDSSAIIIAHPCPDIPMHEVSASEIDAVRNQCGIGKDQLVLLSLGRLVERKGFDMVLLALHAILERVPQVRYVIAGDGPDRARLEHLVKKYHVEKNVVFTGKVPDAQLSAYFALCDVFCMPSRIVNDIDVEGFGMVYLEANVLGKPVVGGNTGGVTDAIIDGETGILISDPTDPDELAHALITLLKDPVLRGEMGEAGRERVLREFTWKKQFGELLQKLNS